MFIFFVPPKLYVSISQQSWEKLTTYKEEKETGKEREKEDTSPYPLTTSISLLGPSSHALNLLKQSLL